MYEPFFNRFFLKKLERKSRILKSSIQEFRNSNRLKNSKTIITHRKSARSPHRVPEHLKQKIPLPKSYGPGQAITNPQYPGISRIRHDPIRFTSKPGKPANDHCNRVDPPRGRPFGGGGVHRN
jgi:hypothetical protein